MRRAGSHGLRGGVPPLHPWLHSGAPSGLKQEIAPICASASPIVPGAIGLRVETVRVPDAVSFTNVDSALSRHHLLRPHPGASGGGLAAVPRADGAGAYGREGAADRMGAEEERGLEVGDPG